MKPLPKALRTCVSKVKKWYRLLGFFSFLTLMLSSEFSWLTGCVQKSQKSETSSEFLPETAQPLRPAIENLTAELEKNASQQLKQELLDQGPFTKSELDFLFATAESVLAASAKTDLILFFARDSDPIFDIFSLLSKNDKEVSAHAHRFFLNTYLYRDKDSFEKYLKGLQVTPGQSMVLFDTGFGGSNFRYLMTSLVQLGQEMKPALSARQVLLPLKPLLISSTAASTWNRDLYMLSEPQRIWDFIDDVYFPEVSVPEGIERLFVASGNNRRKLVEKLENKELIQKWEFHPREWRNALPFLRAKEEPKRVEVQRWQKQIASYFLLYPR